MSLYVECKKLFNKADNRIVAFRARVGGDLTIFLFACSLLLYPLVLLPAVFYYLWLHQWKAAEGCLLISIGTIILSRGYFLVAHLFKRWIHKLFE